MFSTAPARTNTLIAGRHAGKRVTITSQVEPIWRELVKLTSNSASLTPVSRLLEDRKASSKDHTLI